MAFVTATEEEDEGTCDYSDLPDGLLLRTMDMTSSTQDEARQIVEDQDNLEPDTRIVAVTAREQGMGRGTNGRSWMGTRGNTFVTIAVRLNDWMNLPTKIPLTLLPLKIGALVAQQVENYLLECHGTANSETLPMVTVKWPNDVLVDERKISGVLIESSTNGWFLIGIGVNLAYAPDIPPTGPNQGRPATCLQDLCPPTATTRALEGRAEQLGVELAKSLHSFLLQEEQKTTPSDSALEVLNDWKRWVDWDMELVMRDTPQQERVRMVDVLPDGRIQVQNKQDGELRTLVSDYFL